MGMSRKTIRELTSIIQGKGICEGPNSGKCKIDGEKGASIVSADKALKSAPP